MIAIDKNGGSDAVAFTTNRTDQPHLPQSCLHSSITIPVSPQKNPRYASLTNGGSLMSFFSQKRNKSMSHTFNPTNEEDYQSESGSLVMTSIQQQQQQQHPSHVTKSARLRDWGFRTKVRFSFPKNIPNSTDPPATGSNLYEADSLSQLQPPDSEVERIVKRLEHRNDNRVPVTSDVKCRFFRLCKDCKDKDKDKGDPKSSNRSINSGGGGESFSLSRILREDIIQIRNAIRLEVEGRSKFSRITNGIKAYFGVRCHCEVLLNVLNRAVDSIDESGHTEAKKRMNRGSGTSVNNSGRYHNLECLEENFRDDDNNNEAKEWFYYKDFAFYFLKTESNYPWMRDAGIFSIFTTLAFHLFSPILWCYILRDPNICPPNQNGWLSSIFFASDTMSTVGYGDVSVFVGSDAIDTPEPPQWTIVIGIFFMILSLVVSVVGFQAGLDSQFYPFRNRLDIFGRRVYEILRDANIVKGADDKHEDIISRMRWSKFSQLAEIILIFVILNLVGMFAVQVSLSFEKEDPDLGEKLSISWIESFYWAVQTTTTIGYGDIDTPDNLRWFSLLYLATSTYFVGSAFGKLGELSKKNESMWRFYLWQQQEASYTMLADFSGRPDSSNSEEGAREIMDFEPEIDQFEFTIASLVLMGKITTEDVRPIIEKFQRLTGENPNKITSADVSRPLEQKDIPEEILKSEQQNPDTNPNEAKLSVRSKIAQAFREEILSSSDRTLEEKEIAIDYSNFRIPKNTYAIAIDDSKIQRKLLAKFFDLAGIPPDHCTVVGDGHDEIMGFEDYVVKFMEDHTDGYVFLIVEENLDVVDESSKHDTISGSLRVEKIRERISIKSERRMFALIRSANDSSSDISIYNQRAHGFLPKAPIKREKVNETLAPMWQKRFPPSEFGESISFNSRNDTLSTASDDIACTPYDIAQKVIDIESLFEKNAHVTQSHLIHDQMHKLKGDMLTLNSNVSVTSVVAQINLVQVTQAPETIFDKWRTLRDNIHDIIHSLQKNFRLPNNTYAIGIDDSKIQRKLLAKFFDIVGIPPDHCTIIGDGADEIKGFEEFVVNFIQNHKNDYVFMIVDENLDVVDESSNHETISGSLCVDNIRKRLPNELERRMFALIRSANDSTSDISIYTTRAHGFLPKSPIKREKVNETLAPLWLRRFPPSEFGDSADFDATDETMSICSEELACTPDDIKLKVNEIDSLFELNEHYKDRRLIHDELHELKGDILTLNSDASMIPILGTINLMLLGHSQDPDAVHDRWRLLQCRIIKSLHDSSQNCDGSSNSQTTPKAATLRILKRTLTSARPFAIKKSHL